MAYTAEQQDLIVRTIDVIDGAAHPNPRPLFEALKEVVEYHRPYSPPEGSSWLTGGNEPHCQVESSGDPWSDVPWPCHTLQIIFKHFGIEVPGD